jgi:hypothetical protein
MPPTAAICCEYALPVSPAGNGEAVEMTSGVKETVKENVPEITFAGVALSPAVTVKLKVPDAVGFPMIEPAEDIVSPAGSAPPAIE